MFATRKKRSTKANLRGFEGLESRDLMAADLLTGGALDPTVEGHLPDLDSVIGDGDIAEYGPALRGAVAGGVGDGIGRGNVLIISEDGVEDTPGVADIEFFFGDPGDVPIIGDWDGDGEDAGIGVAEIEFIFGDPGDDPFGGDFDYPTPSAQAADHLFAKIGEEPANAGDGVPTQWYWLISDGPTP